MVFGFQSVRFSSAAARDERFCDDRRFLRQEQVVHVVGLRKESRRSLRKPSVPIIERGKIDRAVLFGETNTPGEPSWRHFEIVGTGWQIHPHAA